MNLDAIESLAEYDLLDYFVDHDAMSLAYDSEAA